MCHWRYKEITKKCAATRKKEKMYCNKETMEKCAATRKQWKNVLQQGNNGKMCCNKETMEKCAATRK